MSLILKLLGGTVGPYILGAVGVFVASVLLILSIQSARLAHAKADLVTARAALVDPVSRRTWKDIAGSAIAGRDAALASLARQNAAVTVMQQLSDRKLAEAAQALSVASQGRASAEARAARLMAHPPAGIDACARMEAADAAVLGNLK